MGDTKNIFFNNKCYHFLCHICMSIPMNTQFLTQVLAHNDVFLRDMRAGGIINIARAGVRIAMNVTNLQYVMDLKEGQS